MKDKIFAFFIILVILFSIIKLIIELITTSVRNIYFLTILFFNSYTSIISISSLTFLILCLFIVIKKKDLKKIYIYTLILLFSISFLSSSFIYIKKYTENIRLQDEMKILELKKKEENDKLIYEQEQERLRKEAVYKENIDKARYKFKSKEYEDCYKVYDQAISYKNLEKEDLEKYLFSLDKIMNKSFISKKYSDSKNLANKILLYRENDKEVKLFLNKVYEQELMENLKMKSLIKNKKLIGLSKEDSLIVFEDWERRTNFENNVDSYGIKFQNNDLIVILSFDQNNIVEGVSFLSQDVSDNSGENSYVNRNYTKLLDWATNDKNITVEKNNSTQYPVEIYIGNTHD